MSVTPDYFLLLIIVGGLLIILTSATIYLSGCTEWVMTKFTSKSSPPETDLEGNGNDKDTPAFLRSSIIAAPPRPVGTGFYTSSPFWSAPPPMALPGEMLGFEQAFPPPEWMSGYLFGLQASTVCPTEDASNSVLYSGGILGIEGVHNHPQYTTVQLNTGNPELMAHIAGSLGCDEHGCSDDVDDHMGMDFGDGGAAAAF